MGQKDLTQKNLENYPDVFADTVNALLYEGEQVLLPQNLQPAPTETLYRGQGGVLRNQFHDVSQYEMRGGRIRVQYTLENETRASSKMILRKAGYEGAIYRNQYEKKKQEIYPVISLILHWGKGKWRTCKSLHELFQRQHLPESTRQCIEDMRLQVYDMRCLSKEQRGRFTSDMRIVVDYLAEGEKYQATNQPILHVEAFLRLMREVSGDLRYERMISKLEQNKEGEITMCGLLDKYEARGIEKGVIKGENLLAKLMECLFRDNRMADARLVVTDAEARKRLYREYNLI